MTEGPLERKCAQCTWLATVTANQGCQSPVPTALNTRVLVLFLPGENATLNPGLHIEKNVRPTSSSLYHIDVILTTPLAQKTAKTLM